MKLRDKYIVFGDGIKKEMRDKNGELISLDNILKAVSLNHRRIWLLQTRGKIKSWKLDSDFAKKTLKEINDELPLISEEILKVLNKKGYLSSLDFERMYLEKLLELKGQYEPFDELLERIKKYDSFGHSDEIVCLFHSEELTIENFKKWENGKLNPT